MVKKIKNYFFEQKMISKCSYMYMDQKSQSQLFVKTNSF